MTDEFEAGKRSEISREDIELAKAYEKKRMPLNIRYPVEGDIYEALQDCEIDYLTTHLAPFTGGGQAMLPRGERVRVSELSEQKPLSVYCAPVNYDLMHDRIVPVGERASPNYLGYYFSIDTLDLNRCFRRVESSNINGDPR